MPCGNLAEIDAVIAINKGGIALPSSLKFHDCIAIHVNTHRYSSIHDRTIKPKSDIYLGQLNPGTIKSSVGSYINEDDAKRLNIVPIARTGMSVKINQLYTSTIQKISPVAFKKIYSDLELGAGASIYCTNEEDLLKNQDVLRGWGTNEENFYKFFELLGITGNLLDLSFCIQIKSLSNLLIEEKTNTDEKISKLLFTGEGMFEDPYFAPWLLVGDIITQNNSKKLKVTTGSGRSSGKYQLSFKLDTKSF